jgi:hypothetical protein
MRADPYYRNEVVPQALLNARARIATGLRLPLMRIGTKGNEVHYNGFHRSQQFVLKSPYSTNRRYSVFNGLSAMQSRYIAALDISPYSKEQLLWLCKNLDRATRSGQCEVIVAWYGNVNGDRRVDGYDNVQNVVASSDLSHLTHAHLSLDRRLVDSEFEMSKVSNAVLGLPMPGAKTVPAEDILNAIQQLWLQQANELLFGIAAGVDPIMVSPHLNAAPVQKVKVPNNLAKGVLAADDDKAIAEIREMLTAHTTATPPPPTA